MCVYYSVLYSDQMHVCCQALDSRNEREQRSIQLIDMLCVCREELLALICEALIADNQQQIVNDFIRRNDLQQPGSLGQYDTIR